MDMNCKVAINAIELQRGMLELFRVCADDLTALCPQVTINQYSKSYQHLSFYFLGASWHT